ncbi:serine hydrolase domain-containing protein [Sphingomonas jatrophae]|uniref:CubicO group peptidase, beta-lactamase class C family n=1 Tax=Sphingomonas jatrophae TaxID=1166337 RepID=A0A1I6LLJ1_9SPHN|nr:serine hydrolase domain-containing protein [Sphingomonas jatrophae]SFS04263.1 CubicO group peptidase, beta-lactamase class C family [Sphingomonas jatrophae]
MRPILALLLFAAPVVAQAQPFTPAEEAQVDSLVQQALQRTGVPSASVAVVRGGKLAFTRAYGDQRGNRMAALPDARYAIASVSKQITAAAVLLLAEQGRLSLDDKVAKWLPDLTDADKVTIRQLLSHTSGYRDYWPQDYAFSAMEKPTAPQGILDRWAKLPLDFAPGSQWQYSNTGYVAAARIVEKASGQDFHAFIQSRILRPAGVTGAVPQEAVEPIDARGFHRFALGPVRRVTPEGAGWLYGAGDWAMSAADLARWNIARIDRRVLRPASWERQEKEVVLTDGTPSGYGLGVTLERSNGFTRISHGGEANGFLTANRVYAPIRGAVVVMVNADFGNAQTTIADGLEAILIPQADTTRVARELWDQVRSGRIDRARFTDNGNYYFTAQTLEDYRTSLTHLGEPTSFVRTGPPRLRGGFTVESYVLTFPTTKLRIVLRAEPKQGGRVEQFTVYPEG